MTKIAILGDLHWGARSDNPQIIDHFSKFFREIFFPELEKRGINKIIQCGDLVDRRKFININTAHELHKNFTDPIIEKNLSLDVIVGNHDTFYKGTNNVNALNILYRNAPNNIRYFYNPTEVIIDGIKFLYLPWICDDNYELATKMVDESNAKYAIAHLELAEFEMYRGHVATEGMSPLPFNKFGHVFTGHYHTKSTRGNITYVGTPYELIWSDYSDPRGFLILDTISGTVEFCHNPNKLHYKIQYDENIIDIKNFDYSKYKNTYVKIIILNNKKEWMLDEFLSNFNKVETIDLQVIDESITMDTNVEINIDEVEDTFKIMTNYVDKLEVNHKATLKTELINLYIEANQISKE